MNDRRSDPGNSKKRPQRADGAKSRRADGDARRGAGSARNRKDNPGRRSESSERRGGSAGRRGQDPVPRGEAAGRDRLAAGQRGVPERSGAPRRDDRRPEPEPGFGPFRGSGPPRPRRRDDEAQAVRSVAEEAVARASGEGRPALRVVRSADDGGLTRKGRPDKGKKAAAAALKAKPAKRGSPAPTTAGQRPKPVRDGARFQEALIRGARALDRGYENEALRILRPYRELFPDSAELRELLGLTYYRLGKWNAAQKELDVFVGLTDSTEQHPVLMDVARALGKYKRVEQLWEELRAVSPGAPIVTEGRIVAAGALADQGKLDQAIKVLERAPANPKRILPHHLRLWYALADLHERAGDIPAARALFRKISAQDPSFVDVADRLAALT